MALLQEIYYVSVNEQYLLQITFILKIGLYFFFTFYTLNFTFLTGLGSFLMRNYFKKAVDLLLDEIGTWVFSTLGSNAGIMTVEFEQIYQLQLVQFRITFNHTLIIID